MGLHQCYLPTPLRKGTEKDRTGLVKGEHPWGKCLAWGNLGLVNANGAELQQTTGGSHGELPLVEGLLSCMESSWGTQK